MAGLIASVTFLVAVGGAVVVWALAAKRRTGYDWAEAGLYFPCFLLTKLLWRTEVPAGGLPVPKGTGCVLISNHRSSVDPFFLQVVAGRRVHWLVAKEFCDHAVFGPFLRSCQVIPTRRGGADLEATRGAMRYVEAGGCVGMFPEGRINVTRQTLLPVRPGAILVALRTDAPIVPCYIEGSPYAGTAWSPLLMPARVKVRIGRPIRLADLTVESGSESSAETSPPNGETEGVDRAALTELTRRCVREILRLGGHPDKPVELAGRSWKADAATIERERRTGRAG